jgi:hypothetical protein
MAKSSPLSIPVIIGLKGKGLDEAIRDTKKLSRQLDGLASGAIKAAAGFAAFKGGQLVANFARDAIDAGRDLQVNLNGLQSVFGNMTPTMIEFARGADEIGLSMVQASKASTFIGSVLKQSGFAMEEVTGLTKDLVRAAADLSLTFGYDVQEALLAITALFRGEYDPIEKFGVAMKQNEIEGEKLARGLEGLTGAAERLVDQQIRVNLFFERAADSLGAYERQAGTLRVAQDQLRARFANMMSLLGVQLLPVVADLTAALIPMVEVIGPVLQRALQNVIPFLSSLANNQEAVTKTAITVITAIANVVTIMATLAKMIIDNIGFITNFIKVTVFLATSFLALKAGIAIFTGLRTVIKAFGIQLNITKGALIGFKIALAGIPILGWISALSLIADVGYGVKTALDATGESLEEAFDEKTLNDLINQTKAANEALVDDMQNSAEDLGEAGGAAAKNFVGDFYSNLSNEVEKQKAKLRLETLGASEGLVQAILGSGEGWQQVFNDVVSRGVESVAKVQAMFRATAAGFDEAMSQWEEEYGEPFREFKEDALAARDALIEFTREIQILPSVAETLGEFERSAVDNLASIEEKLAEAFDNGQLLDGSYQNLLQYARDEFQVLRQIERQRDEIIGRRDAAEALINSVQRSIQSGARLVGILGNVTTEAEGVDVVEFATRTVSAGTSLKEFRTALLYNFVEPIQKAKSRADELVSGYRAVVERTREFVDNLKALRALGLDPMLFNQLVEAGVEAGGETAKALIEGGADTVNEVNSLFKELDTLGMELGENTAQVMYGQGENFVNGIVEGLAAQAGELEISAQSIAEAFTTTFEEVLISGINAAIDAAEAAMARMPRIEDFVGDLSFDPRTGDDDTDSDNGALDVTQLPGYRPAGFQYAGGTLNARVQAAAQQARANLESMGPIGFDKRETVTVAGTQVSRGNVTYNVYTQSSTRETANALSQLNSKTGSSRTTTSVRALSDFSVG